MSTSGPPKRVRSDMESALSTDLWGTFCERYGIVRELHNVGKSGHGPLALLDRRVQLFRLTASRLSDAMSADNIVLDPQDLASEVMFAMNSAMSFNGHSPYQCLFGCVPRPIFSEDCETTSSLCLKETLPFYQHQQVRLRCLASFQEGLLQQQLQPAMAA